ncbi:hypothetical protein DIPPA_10418 [Diplonema papillatum]|nr:hypothetical protein DIPPA_10418 [Diplonema papillatum]|eukprot:gene15794-24127_t
MVMQVFIRQGSSATPVSVEADDFVADIARKIAIDPRRHRLCLEPTDEELDMDDLVADSGICSGASLYVRQTRFYWEADAAAFFAAVKLPRPVFRHSCFAVQGDTLERISGRSNTYCFAALPAVSGGVAFSVRLEYPEDCPFPGTQTLHDGIGLVGESPGTYMSSLAGIRYRPHDGKVLVAREVVAGLPLAYSGVSVRIDVTPAGAGVHDVSFTVGNRRAEHRWKMPGNIYFAVQGDRLGWKYTLE